MSSVLNGFNTVEVDSNVSKLYFLLMQCGIAEEGQEGLSEKRFSEKMKSVQKSGGEDAMSGIRTKMAFFLVMIVLENSSLNARKMQPRTQDL
jgi:hypothetical protein